MGLKHAKCIYQVESYCNSRIMSVGLLSTPGHPRPPQVSAGTVVHDMKAAEILRYKRTNTKQNK